MTGGPDLTVDRRVIVEVARQAALEVPEVLRIGRGGSAVRRRLSGAPISVKVRDRVVDVRVWLIARPGADLVATSERVRTTVGAAMERLLGLQLGTVTVYVDGVG
ncbi:MAG TPA: Asp23/Gls24 family envelope stress response protein [Candidatus Limnocylindrales bacterium]|nr:Asp23/Gls24 family envelope stress response protein [Candidatus Limnocylindrales bacterium]